MATNTFGHIAGGLLSGIGQGMVLSGREKRRMAREQLRQQRSEERQKRRIGARREEAERNREFRSGEAEKTREHQTELQRMRGQQGGLFGRTVTDREGNVWGVTRQGEKIDLGIKKAPGGGSSMSAKQAVDTAIDINTKVDPKTGLEDVDWDGAARYLEQKGFAAEAANVRQRVERSGQEQRLQEARQQAEREAEERKSLFKPRSSEFAETGGDVDAWIEQRAQEIAGGQTTRQRGRSETQEVRGEQKPPAPGRRTVKAGEHPLAPRDPQQREVGKTYRSPTGRVGVWTGQGWRPVE